LIRDRPGRGQRVAGQPERGREVGGVPDQGVAEGDQAGRIGRVDGLGPLVQRGTARRRDYGAETSEERGHRPAVRITKVAEPKQVVLTVRRRGYGGRAGRAEAVVDGDSPLHDSPDTREFSAGIASAFSCVLSGIPTRRTEGTLSSTATPSTMTTAMARSSLDAPIRAATGPATASPSG